jgi:hypothetical protein
MSELPGCPCSICDEDAITDIPPTPMSDNGALSDTNRLQIRASVDLRAHIAQALTAAAEKQTALDCTALADAVIIALDLRIEDKYKSASGEQQFFGVSGFYAAKVADHE